MPFNSIRAVNITANSVIVPNATAWNEAAGTNELLTKTQGCGEYRFVDSGESDIVLEFYIEQECTVEINEIDTMMASIRLDSTLSDFYSTGLGIDGFKASMAVALTISEDQITCYGVREGSVIIGFYISPEWTLTPTEKINRISDIRSELVSKVNNNNLELT